MSLETLFLTLKGAPCDPKLALVCHPCSLLLDPIFTTLLKMYLTQKKKVHPDQVKPLLKAKALKFQLKFSRSRTEMRVFQEKKWEEKKLRFCGNPEGEISLTTYVPSSQRKHSARYKSLTKPLRFDFYLSNYCQHILYISFKRLNPIFQFIKLFPTFTEFYIKSETYLN